MLVPAAAPDPDGLADAALAESGEGYAVSASGGRVSFPAEGTTFSQVLSVADARLYEDKARRRAPAARD